METYNFRQAMSLTYTQLTEVATLNTQTLGGRLTKKQIAQAQADRIPPQLINYGQHLNGLRINWTTKVADIELNFNVLPLQLIYGPNLEGELYFGLPGEDPRLRVYRPVDNFTNESSVGLLHDELRSAELYYYNIDDELLPTGIDLCGYFELLQLTLGVVHWQSLLVQLASAEGQQRPFQLQPGVYGNMAERALANLRLIRPALTLEQVVARYDAVKLPPAHTWQTMAQATPTLRAE